jgi:hypothetical protein
MDELNRNESLTVGTSAVVVSKSKTNKTKRKSIILINSSSGSQVITIAIDKIAADKEGIPLYPGGSWQDSEDKGYIPTQKQITAISNIAGGVLSIQERLE